MSTHIAIEQRGGGYVHPNQTDSNKSPSLVCILLFIYMCVYARIDVCMYVCMLDSSGRFRELVTNRCLIPRPGRVLLKAFDL